MTDRSVDGEPDEDQAAGGEAPRLQSTGEREAIRLPLPDGEPDDATDDPAAPSPPSEIAPPAEGDEAGTQPGPTVHAPASDEISPPSAPEATPWAEADDDAATAVPGPEPEAAAAAGAWSYEPTSGPPPYAPASGVSDLAGDEPGPPAEVLIGAAFAGGIVAALVLRRVLR